MKIYAQVHNSATKKIEFDESIDFIPCTSFVPNDLWLVAIDNEGDFDNEKIEKIVQIRKIQQVLIGKVLYKHIEFHVQLAMYCGGNEMREVIIRGFSHSHGDYHLTNSDLFDLISNDIHIFDFEELKTMPRFKGKSNIECIECFLGDGYPYNEILNCYDVSGGKIILRD